MAALIALATTQAGAQAKKSCADFTTQQEAQAYYDAHKNDKPGDPDPNDLDSDGDGKACEGLPSSAAGATATSAPTIAPTSAPALNKTGAETGVMAMSGLSLLEAGYGMTLLARRLGVRRRAVPLYLMRKLVTAGRSGEPRIALADDVFLVHGSALAPRVVVENYADGDRDDEEFSWRT